MSAAVDLREIASDFKAQGYHADWEPLLLRISSDLESMVRRMGVAESIDCNPRF